MGIDTTVMYPSTLYATMADDPELEAALFRAYIERGDLSEAQKRKILCDNAIRYYGAP
jgi:hypothetical protein